MLMLGGFVGTTPGAEGSGLPRELLEGTGDTETAACLRLRDFAETYVGKYNATTVSALVARGALKEPAPRTR